VAVALWVKCKADVLMVSGKSGRYKIYWQFLRCD
jgi:hypothetical protein